MAYHSLESCLLDLEKAGMLVRIKEEVDPFLEMAAIHLRVQEAGGPAILFEHVKGSRFRAVSNIFGTLTRSQYIFRNQFEKVQQLINLKQNPLQILKSPSKIPGILRSAYHALPLKQSRPGPVMFQEIQLQDIPQIVHWKMDGGAFITLPQVYTEDPDQPGILQANLGMYRIQISGNDYIPNQEAGLHYQLHRGIGVHQSKAEARKSVLLVSIFVGGPPAHTVAAVMPLPEGISEMTFAGALAGRRFRYLQQDGYTISQDADFVITGYVEPGAVKPEGPFGDHLGYYSLQHPFPVMRIHKVYARQQAIWPFTVVGRPPQEDTRFGELIHALSGRAIQSEIPGLREVYAVDASGVHPLLLAIGQERYTPYAPTQQPAELLTIASHILGTGQLSLAKYLLITDNPDQQLHTHKPDEFFPYLLKRIQWNRDLHFITHTSIDTLDYSGQSLNQGSKVIWAACGEPVRNLSDTVPDFVLNHPHVKEARICLPGILAIQLQTKSATANHQQLLTQWINDLKPKAAELMSMPLWVVCDDAMFTAASLNNFLWVTFTRSNPATDIYGIDAFQINKHWGCNGPLVIDATRKPHHAPLLEKDPTTESNIQRFFEPGAILSPWNQIVN